jgi:hypothetical protein
MLAILTMIKTLFQLLPIVIEGIQVVETLFPANGQGAAKLDLVKGIVSHAYTVGSAAESTFEQVAPAVDLIAKSAVGIMNATGKFSTTAPAVANAPDPVQSLG